MFGGSTMNSRALIVAIPLALALATAGARPIHAAGPVHVSDAYTETFADDSILELCGIETRTTVTERWSLRVFPDGSEALHVTRRYVSEDPRLPIEKGAGTTFTAPDGTRRVVGKPLQLIGPNGGVRILDAGWVEFGDELTVRGPHPSLGVDLADYYCP
jgi:hypothetical protein